MQSQSCINHRYQHINASRECCPHGDNTGLVKSCLASIILWLLIFLSFRAFIVVLAVTINSHVLFTGPVVNTALLVSKLQNILVIALKSDKHKI